MANGKWQTANSRRGSGQDGFRLTTAGMTGTRKSLFAICLLPFAFLLASCVPVDQLPPGAVPNLPAANTAGAAFPDPEPGSTSITSAHFTLKGYSDYDLRNISQTAENLFTKIGNDTGLYTFLASANYTVVVYKDRDEYLKKTHQPEWSHAITAGKAIYFYPDPALEPVFAHQLSHLIFHDYLGDKAAAHKWLDEGLAMSEELSKMNDSDRLAYQNSKNTQLRQNRMPFSQMTFFVTNTEEKRRTDAWTQQVESVTTYLLSQGSALGFAQLLSELKSGADIDRALSDSYPGKFRSLSELESLWKYTI